MRGSSGSEWINRRRVGMRVASMRGRCACMCDSVRHTRHAMELLYKRDQNDAHCVGRVPRARHGNTCHEHHSALETRACIGDRARAPRAAESGIVPKPPSVPRDWEGDNQITKTALSRGRWTLVSGARFLKVLTVAGLWARAGPTRHTVEASQYRTSVETPHRSRYPKDI